MQPPACMVVNQFMFVNLITSFCRFFFFSDDWRPTMNVFGSGGGGGGWGCGETNQSLTCL